MALVRFAEGQQRSGSSGGTVFSHNRSGAYIRARSKPVNPNTARQVVVRNAVRALSIAWSAVLTQLQRDAWNVYAANVSWLNRLGETITLTGLNHFIRSNTPLLQNGLARIDDAPGQFNLATAELALVCSASEATQQVSVGFDAAADWANEDDAHQFVYMGLPQNESIAFFAGPYRLIGQIDGDGTTPPTSPELLAAAFPFVEGQRIWIRTRIIRADGRLSEFALTDFLGSA